MADILRVGAEFDVAPLVAGAAQASAAFDQIKVKLLEVAAASEAEGKTTVAQAARFMAQGLTAKEAAGALQNLGSSAKNAAAAADEAAGAVGLLAEAEEAQAAAADSATAATVRGVSAMGAARVELGALTGSSYMAGYGLARVAAGSEALAPIIQAAFPVFAAIAFIEILDQGIQKLMEWADEAQKVADENAAFDRSVLKSVETLDQAKEKLAALEGPVAALNEKERAMGDQVLDLTSETKQLNKVIEDGPSFWNSLKDSIGGAAVNLGEFLGIEDKAARELETANSQISDSVKQHKDLAGAIAQVKAQIEEERKATTEPIVIPPTLLTPGFVREQGISKEQRDQRIAALEKELADLQRLRQADQTTQTTNQIEADQKLAEEHKKSIDARIAYDKAAITAGVEAHTITYEDAEKELVALEEQGAKAEAATIVGHGKEAADQRAIIEQNLATHILEIRARTDEEIKRRDLARSEATIEADQKEIEAADRAGEAYARLTLAHADTKPELKSASLDLEHRITKEYDDQITAKKLLADALEKSNAAAHENEIAQLRAEAIALDAAKQEALRANDVETAEKIKTLDKRALEDQIAGLNEALSVSTNANRKQEEDNQRLYAEKRESRFTDERETISLAQQEYQTQADAYAKEIALVKSAVESRVLTEAEGQKKIAAIWALETKAHDNMVEQEKRAQDQLTQSIIKDIEKVTNEFNRSLIQYIQGQKTFEQAVRQVWMQIEGDAINAMLKMVEQWLITHVLMAAISKAFGIDDSSQAAAAKKVATAMVVVNADAAQSAADVFLQAIESIPFPANLAAAPALAETAHAEALATATFERGGVVPANLHPGEMVLPEHISTAVQGAIPAIHNFNTAMGNNTNSSVGGATHNHYHMPIVINQNGGKMSASEITAAVRKGIRMGH